MFYDNLKALCKSNSTTVTAVLKELNISTSKGTAWKSGSVPKGDILTKLADYFNVSTDYLLGNTDSMQNVKSNVDPQTAEAIKLFANMPPDKRQLALKILKIFIDDEE